MVITIDWWSFKSASMKSTIAAIEESKRGRGTKSMSVHGMLLSDSLEPSLSHTSILYCRSSSQNLERNHLMKE